jgi:hypothetical protein
MKERGQNAQREGPSLKSGVRNFAACSILHIEYVAYTFKRGITTLRTKHNYTHHNAYVVYLERASTAFHSCEIIQPSNPDLPKLSLFLCLHPIL